MRSCGIFFLVVLSFVSLVLSFEIPCTFTSTSGSFYDLSPLSLCDNSGYTVNTANDGTFVINVCNSVSSCDNSAAVCQDGSYNTGAVTSTTFSSYSGPGGASGVTVKYGNGDTGGCPNNGHRATTINFICDSSATTPVFNFTGENPTCNYNFNAYTSSACPTTKAPQQVTCPIYVYLVPHTHDDVGWIQTPDGYYESEVKHILDTVVANLVANPARKFIYVEQAYFWRWWTDPNTTDTQRSQLKQLYANGQWEFVIGGWVMQDEACTTYGADIDQMTLGHQFLLNTFGAKPTKGWQIDPFGQSTVTATIEKLSGFDAHLIDRVTYKSYYEETQRLQFNWFGSPSLGEEAAIFTEIMDGATNAYCDWYFTFDFENDPVNSGNVASWAQKFYSMVDSRASHMKTNVMLAAWGCDFAFQNATPMFHSMDILVNYLQSNEANSFIYVKYATLSEYFAAVKAVPNIEFPTNNGGDFFPLYESLYWTGYYTSRTQLKGIVRQGEAYAHMAEQVFALSKLILPSFDTTTAYNNLMTLRLANGEAQHHDGVSGTSEPNVVLNFGNEILNGISLSGQTTAEALSSYISKGENTQVLSDSSLSLLNIGTGQAVAVVIYNSLGWTRNDFVVLAVNRNDLQVLDSNNKTVPAQVNPDYALNATGKYNLFFQVNIAPLGFQTYFVIGGSAEGTEKPTTYEANLGADTTLTNGFLTVTVSGTTGRISNITNIGSKLNVAVDQNLLRYTSLQSGAYAFAPTGAAVPVSTTAPTTTINDGPLVTEAYQVFPTGGSSWAKQNIRLFKSTNPDASSFVELDFQIGVLPSHVEVVTSFQTSIATEQIFSTDDNGFEFIEREGLWSAPIESNYYPTIYASYIRDSASQLTVVSERAHGASSQNDGQIEVMIHRNPDMGDGFGPGLTDTTVVFPVNRILVDTPAATTLQVRRQPYLLNFPLNVFTGAPATIAAWKSQYVTASQFASSALPPNVHLLSFNALDGSANPTVIVRLTHLFAVGEDPVYSQPATVDVAALFGTFKISSFQETTLTANAVIGTPSTKITLTAKQIRTFIVTF